jgi:hypothetical protein
VALCAGGGRRELTAGFAAEPQLAAAIANTRLMLRRKFLGTLYLLAMSLSVS